MSKEALPQITPNMEKDIHDYNMMEYLDTENYEFDNEKKALFEKVMKNSTELEAIGHLAKDLNFNIDVNNFSFKTLIIELFSKLI